MAAEYNYRPGLADMPGYDVVERDWRIKINANECGMNLPPLVLERVLSRLDRVAFNRYPNEQADMLREAIAEGYNLNRENVVLGNGSSEIIEKLFVTFGGRGHKIVYPQPSFSMYKIYARAAEAEGVPVDLKPDYTLDVNKFIAAVKESEASLAVICNPNNPTGRRFPLKDVEKIARSISCPLLMDEAYMEFAEAECVGGSAVSLLKKYPHVIVARTFSKAYGLAACRMGYMLAAGDIAGMTGKTMMPYYLNVLSLTVADTVWQMRDEYRHRIIQTIAERNRMAAELKKIAGFTVYPSAANFLLVKYDRAAKLNEYLTEISIGVRSFGSAPRLENTLRFSIGTPAENDQWLLAVQAFARGEVWL